MDTRAGPERVENSVENADRSVELSVYLSLVRRLPPRSDRWAWSARAEILGNQGPETHLSNLIGKTRNLSWAAYVEGWVEGDRIIVRLLVDAPDLPGAVGRTMAFFAREWPEPGERVVAMELHKADHRF
jgi:hypothetical protein